MVEDKERDVLTIEQVAEILQVHYNTAYAKIRSGEIPALKIGHQWRVLRKDLYRYLELQKKKSSR